MFGAKLHVLPYFCSPGHTELSDVIISIAETLAGWTILKYVVVGNKMLS